MTIKNKQRGYTIVEMMAILSFIGALTCTLMIAHQKYIKAMNNVALKIEHQTIATAFCSYCNDYNQFPESGAALAVAGYINSLPNLADYTIDGAGRITQTPR